MLQPICSEVFTCECLSACASVFTQMNSTPSMPLFAMCDTALPPPPPTPITLITAVWLKLSINSNMSSPPLRQKYPWNHDFIRSTAVFIPSPTIFGAVWPALARP